MPSTVTEVDICNLALSHLGEAFITALNDGTERADACELHYPNTRDEVLRSHRWNFATVRTELSETSAFVPQDWTKSFDLPDECLRVLEFNETDAGEIIGQEFVIEKRRLLTDSEAARIVYITREDDTTLYDPIFVKALALKLAVSLSESIRGTTEKTGELLAAYERITAPLARRIDANEGRRRRGMLPLNSTWIHARYSDEMPSSFSR